MQLFRRNRILVRALALPFALIALISTRRLSAEPYTWSTVVIGGGGFVSGLVTTPAEQGLLFARTDVGGAYRWKDATKSWIPLTDWVSTDEAGFMGVESIAIDPSSPNRVYMLVGLDYDNNGKTAVLRSTDRGDHFDVTDVTAQFHAHGNGMGRQTGEKLAVDPNLGGVLLCGTRRSGLFRSTDYGQSWSRLAALDVTTTPNDDGISFVLFDKASGTTGTETRRLYVGISRSGTDNLYMSDDAGGSFSPVPGAPTAYMPGRAALASNGALFVTYGNGAGPSPSTTPPEPMDFGAVWRYQPDAAGTDAGSEAGTDAGSAWTDVTPPLKRAYGGISVDPSNPDHVLATTIDTWVQQPWGYGDRIFRSTDGGATWTDLIAGGVTMDVNGHPWIANHAIHWAGSIQLDPFDPERAFVSSGNGVFMTEDLSASRSTWKFATDGLEETVPQDAVSIPDGPLVSAVADYDGFIHQDLAVSPAAGAYAPSMGSTYGIAVAAARPGTWVRSGSSAYWTDDAGKTWTKLNPPTGVSARGKVALSADGAVLLWSSRATMFRTDDKGATWTTPGGITFRATPVADTVNADEFYAYDSAGGVVYVSTDKGVTFKAAGSAGTGGARLLRVVPGVEGEIWIALNAGGLTRSTNSGASFSRITSVSAASAVGFGKAPEGKTFPAVYMWGTVSGVTGVFRSDDSAATWQRINDDAHQYGGPGNGQFVLGDMNAFGRVFMSSAGRGIVYGQIAGTPTTLPPLVLDAGAPEPDAGAADAGSDAALDASVSDVHPTGGCACRLGTPRDGSTPSIAAFAGLVVLCARRRKSAAAGRALRLTF